jgi:hypothetical protein
LLGGDEASALIRENRCDFRQLSWGIV